MRTLWFVLMVLCAPLSMAAAQQPAMGLETGAGSYRFDDSATGRDVQVYYYQPENYTTDTPVVMVLHGLRRDAQEYRNSWAEYAEKEGLMVLVPRFSAQDYPGGNGFNLGNVFNATTPEETRGFTRAAELNPPEQWVFTLIERVFDDFKAHRNINQHDTYYLYGHGAGAQVAQRFAMFMPDSQVAEIIVGAAGWYTMPDASIEWPYGTGGVTPLDASALHAFYAQPILLLAGGADTATLHTVMRQTPETNAQGATRVERTRFYYEFAQRQARQQNTAFNWRYWELPGVTHRPSQMTPFAARYIALKAR